MKNLLCMLCMTFGIAFGASATGTPKAAKTRNTETKNKTAAVSSKKAMLVEKRANNLSDQMIRELRLNNYQANKVREINLEMAAKITDIEQECEGNEQLLDEKCKAALAVRDQKFEDILSTVQYNNYFGDRKVYTKKDREFVAGLSQQGSENMASNGEAVEGATAGNATAGATTSTVN